MKKAPQILSSLEKCPTGITGLDEITLGGIPKGRPTLVCGNAGCGKSLFALEFIYRGAVQYNEPGVFITFEETKEDIFKNVASLGFDMAELERKKLLALDFVRVERNEIEETGSFDLDGLFIRIGYAIDSIGAKRVVLDTIESLFAGIQNQSILRAEIRRLFNWLKEKGVTFIITGEQGGGTSITRQGLEEYVSDCVIFLDHRILDQFSTRRIRILKYRGSFHGTNEYPFLISETGISILPLSKVQLQDEASTERISIGIKSLDEMFGGKGVYRGSTLLLTGAAGSGKSSILSHFVNSTCNRGEKCIYLAFEESKSQIFRNMSSIGLNLKKWENKGLLKIHSTRAAQFSLEMHLNHIIKMVQEFKPRSIVFDPISSLLNTSSISQANSLLTRLIDYLKEKEVTIFMSNLTSSDAKIDTDVEVSSLVDTWISVKVLENKGEMNRAINIIKSRGMAHSNNVKEFVITENGIKIIDAIFSNDGVLMGSARISHEISNKKSPNRQDFENQIQKIVEVTSSKVKVLNNETDALIRDLKKNYNHQNIIEAPDNGGKKLKKGKKRSSNKKVTEERSK